jgi:cyclic pyranopterin monophosphate synthase
MRDISNKVVTFRTAVAQAMLRVSPKTIERIRNNEIPKGDPLIVAKVAAIQAAKNTSQIIPYCHQIALEFVGVEFHLSDDSIRIETTVKADEKTGVEMEALTAASVAALTIYDMVKMLDDLCEMEGVTLLKKTGGKSDFKPKVDRKVRAAVIVMSDRVSAGKAQDQSGKIIATRLEQHGIEVAEFKVVADQESEIIPSVKRCTDELKVDLVFTTGGTGVGPRDVTPEALSQLIERPLPGVSEAIRSYGQDRNPYAMLSRSSSGIRNNSVIISLPGSRGGVNDALDVLLPYILHAIPMMEGKCHDQGNKQAVSSVAAAQNIE